MTAFSSNTAAAMFFKIESWGENVLLLAIGPKQVKEKCNKLAAICEIPPVQIF